MFKFVGKHAGTTIFPRQSPHRENGSNLHLFWSSEFQVGARFQFIGFWYEVEENSLIITNEVDEYTFCARRIN